MGKGLSPILLDARSREDFETSPLKLPGALRLFPEDAAAGRINLDADADSRQVIVTYCTSPEERTSSAVAQALRQKGLRNVRILKGGLGGWTNVRLPVEAKSHLPSIGLEIYKNLSRATVGVLELLNHPGGLELFCYTPEEFEIKREEMGIVRIALEEGTTL